MRNSNHLISVVCCFCAEIAIAQPADLYVNGACGNDSWTGMSPVCSAPNGPKQSIEAAIGAASDSQIIELAAGTLGLPMVYTGNSNTDVFITKLITVRSATNDPLTCIIDGQNLLGGVWFAGSTTANDTILQGVTIRNCNGSGVIFASPASLRNCRVTDNRAIAANGGGGVFIGLDGQANIEDCLILGNAAYIGAGIYCESASPSIVKNSSIGCNLADLEGGGIMVSHGELQLATLTLVGCEIYCNSAGTSAGGLNAFGGGLHAGVGAFVTAINCEFRGNTVTPMSGGVGRGAGLCIAGGFAGSEFPASLELVNCLVANNGGIIESPPPPSSGAGIFHSRGALTLTNCTIANNRAFGLGGAGLHSINSSGVYSIAIQNTIFWQNTSDDAPQQIRLDDSDNVVTLRSSILQDGLAGISGFLPSVTETVLDADPLFANAANGDYHLLYSSPGHNAGNAGLLPTDAVDLDDDGNVAEHIPHDLDAPNSREICGVEIGCYEINQLPMCPGDCAGGTPDGPNGVVSVDDLLAVINAWGPQGGHADVAPNPCGNGAVDVDDMLIVINNWGSCGGTAGGAPPTMADCFNSFCAGLQGQEWQDCMNKCIEAVCDANPSECD